MTEESIDTVVTPILTPKYIAEALGEAREAGDGFMCSCPAHEDNRASMWIAQVGDGRTVVHCHAGCDSSTIQDLLKTRHLWPTTLGRPAFPNDAYVLEESYRYLSSDGTYVFTKRRLRHKTDGSKSFPQCIERAGQKDLTRLGKLEKPLFLAPQLAVAGDAPVYVVEGEKDVLTLVGAGLVATCHPDGAGGTWTPSQVALLKDRSVTLLPDNDEPGRLHMHRAARALMGVAEYIKLVELPMLPDKGDVSDWFYLNNMTAGDLVSLAEISPDMEQEVGSPGLDWKDNLLPDGADRPNSHLANIATALTGAPDLADRFAIDTFTQSIIVTNPLPWDKNITDQATPEDKNNLPQGARLANLDRDPVELVSWLGHSAGMMAVTANNADRAIRAEACQNSSDSLVGLLEGLPEWDEVARLDNWLAKYCQATDDHEYLRLVGRKWMINAIARGMATDHPVKADTLLVLESWKQGVGKSQLCRVLAMEDKYLLVNPPLHGSTQELAEVLQGKWICEVEEMVAARKAATDHLKAQISRDVDTYRAPYARQAKAHPRRSIFIGTLNLRGTGKHLKDSSGNRRFWCVEVGEIDLEGIRADVHQLWAEAMVAWRSGEKWWMTDEQARLADEIAEDRFDAPDLHEDIEAYITHSPEPGGAWTTRDAPLDRLWSADFFAEVHGWGVSEMRKDNAFRRLSQEFSFCMSRIGWRQAKGRVRETIKGVDAMKRRGAWVAPDVRGQGPKGTTKDAKAVKGTTKASKGTTPSKTTSQTRDDKSTKGRSLSEEVVPFNFRADLKNDERDQRECSSEDLLRDNNKTVNTPINRLIGDICKSGETGGHMVPLAPAAPDEAPEGTGTWYLAGSCSLEDILCPMQTEAEHKRGTIVTFDFETTGLSAQVDDLRLVSFASNKGWCVIDVPLLGVKLGGACWRAGLQKLWCLGLKDVSRVAYNAAFENSWLREALGESFTGTTHDAMLLMSAIYGGSWKLVDAVKKLLGKSMDKKWQKYDWSLADLDPQAVAYSGRDAELTYDLWAALGTVATPENQQGYLTFLEALPAVTEMTNTGLPFNQAAHYDWMRRTSTQVEELETELRALVPKVENWAAPTQREPWLQGEVNPATWSQWRRTEKAARLVWDDKYLTKQLTFLTGDVHTVLTLYLKWRKLATQVNNFGEPIAQWIAGGRLSSDLRIGAALTGRMTSSKPNMQQIPTGEYRGLFQAEPGRKLIVADYSQIEVRVGALLAGETKLFDLVADGFDIHTSMAAKLYQIDAKDVTKDQRTKAKRITFGFEDGQGAKSLAAALGCSQDEARKQSSAWERMFPKMAKARKIWHGDAERTGFLHSISGRSMRVGKDCRFSVASNYPVQGSAADVIYKALKHLVRIREEQCLTFKLCLVVHDEIIIEASTGEAEGAALALELAMIEGYVELWPDGPTQGLIDVKIANTWLEGK